MNYIIYTPSATRLKKEIFDRVSRKADANGKCIATWQCIKTDIGEKVLVYTVAQWAEKGCLTIKQESVRNELYVRFCYWDSCEERDNDDDKYMLARFTELLLVHFFYFVDKVTIQ